MKLRVVVASLLVFVLGACTGTTQYGAKIDTKALGNGGGVIGQFLKSAAPTLLDTPTPSAKPTVKASASVDPHHQKRVSITVTIDDQRGFDPLIVSIAAGGIIRFVNKGPTRIHRVINDPSANISLDSGDLKVGQSWDYVANIPGTWNLDDKYTPYYTFRMSIGNGK